MPGTPITPIPTLPTISEVKGTEHGSSGGSNESAEVKPVPERRKSRRMDEIKEEDAREKLQIRQATGGRFSESISDGSKMLRKMIKFVLSRRGEERRPEQRIQ